MAIHSRVTPFLAVVGALALGAASTARAQDTTNAMPRDTSAAAQSDTSGYRGYQNPADTSRTGQSSTRTDSSGFKYNGPPTDTTLKAAPGAQTGPAAGDSGSAGRTSSAESLAPQPHRVTEHAAAQHLDDGRYPECAPREQRHGGKRKPEPGPAMLAREIGIEPERDHRRREDHSSDRTEHGVKPALHR